MKLELEELTGRIIGSAIDVHRELGPGFLESVYEAALVIALRNEGLGVEAQKNVAIYFRGEQVGGHRLDLLVQGSVIVELKAIKALEDVHFATVRSYLKACRLRHGLLLNFATMPMTVKRVIYSPEISEEGRNAGSDLCPSSFPGFLSPQSRPCH
jgi:GxxExxY protein